MRLMKSLLPVCNKTGFVRCDGVLYRAADPVENKAAGFAVSKLFWRCWVGEVSTTEPLGQGAKAHLGKDATLQQTCLEA